MILYQILRFGRKVPVFLPGKLRQLYFHSHLISSLSYISLSNMVIVSIFGTNYLFLQLGFWDLQRWEVEENRDREVRARNVFWKSLFVLKIHGVVLVDLALCVCYRMRNIC
ncbi:hypothetical protein DVH24_015774 [Malus domestica]|uniref:Uncharacterized protein n=1 Tax=Malus domestica TaxID=3750 RepID=A0A498HMM6_MALDO|nr:hypothetical protein DVH24_015774 [Malus domestica]